MNLLELQFYICSFIPQGKTLWENVNVNLCIDTLCTLVVITTKNVLLVCPCTSQKKLNMNTKLFYFYLSRLAVYL